MTARKKRLWLPDFLTFERIWEKDISKSPLLEQLWFYLLRVVYLVLDGMTRHKVIIRATALSYTTLLSIVPLLAVMLSLFKAFGGLADLAEKLQPFLLKNLAAGTGETVYSYITEFINEVHVGTIGGIGFLALILTVIGLLATIEKAFNDVWGVREDRTFFRRFTAYWSIVTIGPILVATSLGMTTSLQSSVLVQKIFQVPGLDKIFLIVPYLTSWLGLTFLYLFMPNTHVPLRSAAIGGIVAGTLWEWAKFGYTFYAAYAVGYHKIYGSLGAIPIFLIWLYLTWVIVLIGAEIVFADQNVKTYREEQRAAQVSWRSKVYLAVAMSYIICQRYLEGKGALTARELSAAVGGSIRLVNEILYHLTHGGVLLETEGEEGKFIPARPPGKILLQDVMTIFEGALDIHPDFHDKELETKIISIFSKKEHLSWKKWKESSFQEFIS